MTILESLTVLNTFPIPSLVVEKTCLDRGLEVNGTYSALTGFTQEYKLAKADLYVWLASTPDITDQAQSVKISDAVKKALLQAANDIYKEYGDPKFSGMVYGFIGERYNG